MISILWMKKTKVPSHNATHMSSAELETSAWVCGSKRPNIISRRQPKDPLHLTVPLLPSWAKFISKEKCRPELSPLLVTNSWRESWTWTTHSSLNRPGTGDKSPWFAHRVCKGTKCPSVPNHLFKDAYVRANPRKTEMVSASKIIHLMSSFRVKHVHCPLPRPGSPEPEAPQLWHQSSWALPCHPLRPWGMQTGRGTRISIPPGGWQ